MNNKLRIAYIEDQKVVKEGVNFLLSQYPFIQIFDFDFETDRYDKFAQLNKIDVFILDLQLQILRDKKQLNGFDLCEIIRTKFPHIKVIGHSMYDDVATVNKFFKKGGMGFVSKKSGHVELVNAIKQVSEGEKYICCEMVKKAKNGKKFLRREDDTLKAITETFTKAEKSILEKIAKGYSTKQIAQQLEISEKTVETHRKNLFVKADVKNVAELIAYAYSRRIFID
ncbi:MAG: Two component transcriptional regulator, LuxR family [Bacteroidetes bacterium]|nr:Two component transcriptional regulator, LuxR family [Bacteroidota bacterium]